MITYQIKFTFTRKHQPGPNFFTTILSCINCGKFIGFGNGTDIEITHEGINPQENKCRYIKTIFKSMVITI